MPDLAPILEETLETTVLLGFLAQVSSGDFTARMPLEWTGVPGKVADGLNDVVIANQALAAELARVSQVVGKEGRLSQRLALGARAGGGAGGVEESKQLVGDVVR